MSVLYPEAPPSEPRSGNRDPTRRRPTGVRTRPGSAAALVTAALTVLAASCGATVTAASAPPGPRGVHSRRAAAVLAGSILARAPLPPGATVVRAAPAAALRHPPSVPGTVDLVQRTRFAVTGRSPVGVLAALRTHPPVQASLVGRGLSQQGRTVASRFVTFALGGLPAGVVTATLSYAVAAAGRGRTGIRVDAQVTWRPPRAADLRVPPSDRVAIVSVVPLPGRHGPLTPARRVVVTSPPAVARLRAIVDRLPVAQPGARSCPAYLGPRREVAFARSPSSAPDLTFATEPCDEVAVTRGHRVVATLDGGPAFTAAVAAVLRAAGRRASGAGGVSGP